MGRAKARRGRGDHQAPAGQDFPKYSIAVAADLSGVAQQQLRRMEDSGLVAPSRTAGNTRRYSDNDLAQIALVAELSEAGLNAEGIRHSLALEHELAVLRAEVAELRERIQTLEQGHPPTTRTKASRSARGAESTPDAHPDAHPESTPESTPDAHPAIRDGQ